MYDSNFDKMNKKRKILILGAILSSLFGYLEWGGNNHSFLFQAEADVLRKLVTSPKEVLHPLVLIPFMGQVILVYNLFRQSPNRASLFIGLGAILLLFLFIVLVGILAKNVLIVLSTLPFFACCGLLIRLLRKKEYTKS